MRQLEVVAVSDDGTYVLLASDENAVRATHAVRIDSRLNAAIRGELDDDSDDRRESELTPRDIQARLRAGETPEAVARAAKVSLSRVMRYAGPVISERERIVGQARAAVLQRARGPELTTPLGEVVEQRLAETIGLRSDTIEWDAKRRDDGNWIIELAYTARGGARSASWLWQPGDRELTSVNALATRLGAEPGAKRPAPRRSAPKPAAKSSVARRAAVAKSAAAKRTARPAPTKKAATATATTKRPAPRKQAVTAGTRKSTVKPAPNVAAKRQAARPVAKQAAPGKPMKAAATRSPVKQAPRKVAAKRRTPRSERPLIEPSVKRVNGRVEVPSWSDVLLGVQAPASSRGRRRS